MSYNSRLAESLRNDLYSSEFGKRRHSGSKGNKQQGDYDPLRHVNRLHPKEEDFILPYPKDDSWEKGNAAITRLLGDVAEIIEGAPYVCPNRKCNLLK